MKNKLKSDWEKEQKEHFEANMLDGDRLEDCGKAMLSAESAFEYLIDALQWARQGGIEEAIEFMKGKVIDMPVGSGRLLVVKEAQVRNWLNRKSELKKKGGKE